MHLSIWNKISGNIAGFINNHCDGVPPGGKNQLYLSLPTGSAPTPKNVLQRKLPSSLLRCFSIKYRVAKGPMAHYRPANQPSCISLPSSDGHSMRFPRNFQSNLSAIELHAREEIKYRSFLGDGKILKECRGRVDFMHLRDSDFFRILIASILREGKVY